MLKNSQMIAGRFKAFALAKRKLAFIKDKIAEGKVIYLSTYGHHTKVTAKSVELVKASKSGLWVQHGKRWLNYDGAAISAQ